MERQNSHRLAKNGDYITATMHPDFLHPLKSESLIKDGISVSTHTMKAAAKIIERHPPETGRIIVLLLHKLEQPKQVPI